MKLKIKDVLKNKYLLYFVAIVAFFILINLILANKFTGILLFYVSGLLAYYFTKNMTIVLGVAIISTFFAHLLDKIFNLQEGFKEGAGISCTNNEQCSESERCDGSFCVPIEPSEATEATDSLLGVAKAERYQNQIPLKPSALATPSKESVAKQLGKASKLESAYDNLENVIGSNGIKSMSSDTEKLISKQSDLLKQLKELTPELNKTIDSVSKIDLNGLVGSFKSVSDSINTKV